MKKYRFQLLLVAFLFFYENTSAYWINHIGIWGDYIDVIYFISFLACGILLFYNLIISLSEKLKDKTRNLITFILSAVIIIALLFPGGLIPKRLVYKGDLLTAFLDGVAGNNAYLVLYGNNIYEFDYTWSYHLKGNYKIVNDTIFFDSPTKNGLYVFDYATLSKDKKRLYLAKDSIVNSYLFIIKNELIE